MGGGVGRDWEYCNIIKLVRVASERDQNMPL